MEPVKLITVLHADKLHADVPTEPYLSSLVGASLLSPYGSCMSHSTHFRLGVMEGVKLP